MGLVARGALGAARQGRREPAYQLIWRRPRTPHRGDSARPGGSALISPRPPTSGRARAAARADDARPAAGRPKAEAVAGRPRSWPLEPRRARSASPPAEGVEEEAEEAEEEAPDAGAVAAEADSDVGWG